MKLFEAPCSDRSVAEPSDTAVEAAAAVPKCLDEGAIVWQKLPKCSGINLSVTWGTRKRGRQSERAFWRK